MDIIENFHTASCAPFDMRNSNCAHAVAAAFRGYPKAQEAAKLLAHVDTTNPVAEARRVAWLCGMPPVLASGQSLAWGVCKCTEGHAICIRVAGYWWRRGIRSVHRVRDCDLMAAWGIE